MNREDLEAMTKPELVDHAKVQGIDLDAAEKKGTMVDKILGEHKAAPAKSPRAEESLPALGTLSTLQGEKVNGKKYRVTIFSTETDKSDVDIICNGHNIRVRRGVEVIMQEAYVDILRNAVVETTVQDPDTGMRAPQRLMVYPHTAIPV